MPTAQLSAPTRRLTADLCAVAIVAAAKAYGDDPVVSLTAECKTHRRALSPAAMAVATATGLSMNKTRQIFGLSVGGMWDARRKGGEGYQLALTQALLAVGGPALALAPERQPATRKVRTQLELHSGQPDALLIPRPDPRPIDLGDAQIAPPQAALTFQPAEPVAETPSDVPTRDAEIIARVAAGESYGEVRRAMGLERGVVAAVMANAEASPTGERAPQQVWDPKAKAWSRPL